MQPPNTRGFGENIYDLGILPEPLPQIKYVW
jgi:hypothetical protein